MLPTWSWEYPLSLLSSFSSFTSSSPSPGINITSLTPLLSPSAQIILPSSPLFTNFSSRFTQAAIPSYAAIIAVSTENDVVETIKFANTLGIPFLATGTSHGAWAGLNDFQGGIGIWLRNLTKFELNSQGDEVTLGGGLRSVDVVSRLWEVKKQTTTGVCECVSLAAPALGGGHGYLQGQRGLVADQLVSARVVLADGRVVTASSDTGNGGDGDLFWAIKGAGHNFGVVTEMVFKVYDVVKPEWAYEYLFFTGDKVGELYQVANAMLETQAAEAVLWTTWVRMPDVDPINPVVVLFATHNGPADTLVDWVKPLHALGPYHNFAGVATYDKLAAIAGFGLDGNNCQKQAFVSLYPADVPKYDVDAIKAWYDVFNNMMQAEPALAGSFCMLEQYPTQAVQEVSSESTAYGLRDQKLLLAPAVIYAIGGNKTLETEAFKWGEKMRNAAFGKIEKRHSYVNYARGNEKVEELYGHEQWRLDKLRALKQKYDPENKFGFYGGINL